MSFSPELLTFTVYDLNNVPLFLPVPVEFEVVKSYDSPAQSFEGIFLCRKLYPEFYKITVYQGEKRLFEGLVDEQTITENDQGRRLKLLARSYGAVLLDNEAHPNLYKNLDLKAIFDMHIRPYGFQTLQIGTVPYFNAYQVDKGMSEWEVFYNFYRYSQLGVAFMDDNCNIVCPGVDPPRGTTHTFDNHLAGAKHYTNLKVTNNRFSPVSKYVIRDKNGIYSSSYTNPNADPLKISRTRYLIPALTFAQSEGFAGLDARDRVMRSMLGKMVITLTCPDLVGAPLDRVNLNTGLESYLDLFVLQARYKLGNSGITTTLTLVNGDYV